MTSPVFFNQYINANHQTLCELIQALFDRHSKLLVIRLDLIYKNEFREELTLEKVQEHRDRLLDNRRRHPSLFGHLAGYAWSLEWGGYRLASGEPGAGWHHHFIFFFDGQCLASDWTLGKALADYCDTVITKEKSSCFVSNLHKERLIKDDTLGIGLIPHFQTHERNNLLNHVAGYLAKGTMPEEHREVYDQHPHLRRFGCSRMPTALPEGTPRLGRPRKAIEYVTEGGVRL